ncbi:MAG: TonB-dependent receptor [Steroidobacteraceae bacterium]
MVNVRQAVLKCAATSLALILVLTAAGPLHAQTAAPGGASASAGELEEILVTATRRSEALSKVPISVTALSQESMDDRGIKDFQDIARYTPGINFDSAGTNAISIRGISSSGGAGTTGIYIDDTPIQMRSVGFNPDDTLPKTFDLERVEVLRGPQGTLFGAGSEGGTVRYLLTAPKLHGSSTYMRGELSFTEGGQPSYELGFAQGGALIEGTLGVRANAWYRKDGGWIDRVDPTSRAVTESNANHGDAYMLRLAAVWQPLAAVTVTPSIIYQKSNKHDQSTFWPAYSNPSAGEFNNATPERIPVPDKYLLPSLKLEANFAHSQLIATTSYFSRDEISGYQGTVYDLSYYQGLGWVDNPNTGGLGCGAGSVATEAPCDWYPLIDANGIHLPSGFSDYQSPNTITNAQRSWTQEIRLQSSDDQSPWRWTVGAFWQQSKQRSIEELRDAQINELFTALYGIDAISIYGDFYSCNGQGTYTAIPACVIYYNNNSTTDRQLAAFGELSYAFTERWRLTLGDRIARTSFSLQHYGDGLENYGPETASAAQQETPNTPKLSLAFQMDSRNLFYATLAKGFRVGGGNPPLPSYCDADVQADGYANGAPLTYKSDTTQSYEIGSKNSFGPGLKLATSVYYIKWRDIQQSVYVGGGCGLQFTDNLGTAVAKGFDLQAESRLGPMNFDLAVGYTDARYTKATLLANTGNAISGQDSINLSPGTTAPWTVAVGAAYEFQLASHAAFVRLDYQYQSRNNWLSTFQDPNSLQYNADTYALPSTQFVQLRGGAHLGNWQVSAFVDNLFNTHTVTNYQLGQLDAFNPDPPHEQQNQYTFRPRTFGLTATLHL